MSHRILVAAPEGALDAIAPLLDAYRQRFSLTTHDTGSSLPDKKELAVLGEHQDALLLIGNRKYAPRTVLYGPFIKRADGGLIPAAWLPYTSDEALNCFATNAAQVHERQQPANNTVALLGQWNKKYLNLAARIEALLREAASDHHTFRWTSDYLIREDMIDGLNTGLAMAIYVGHGRPVGWVGYRGTRAHHFSDNPGKPVGALFSLCCETASRRRNGLSFSESIPLMGKAAGAFGAIDKSLHMDNVRWATGICHGIKLGQTRIGELLKT
ncbi:MAG TPA: hypothetical protein ENJ08_03730, partial [Gammaproteobacteria bacterium]|nr:hypothetical protein [Gammaproteobacteria bacterium]